MRRAVWFAVLVVDAPLFRLLWPRCCPAAATALAGLLRPGGGCRRGSVSVKYLGDTGMLSGRGRLAQTVGVVAVSAAGLVMSRLQHTEPGSHAAHRLRKAVILLL